VAWSKIAHVPINGYGHCRVGRVERIWNQVSRKYSLVRRAAETTTDIGYDYLQRLGDAS